MVDAARSIGAKRVTAESSRETAAPAFSITVASAAPEILGQYSELCGTGVFAPAQSPEWVATWTAKAETDHVIAVFFSSGRPVFALALEIVRAGPVRIARFMGGSHANGNFAAADPSWLATAGAAEMQALTAEIGRARPDIDIVALERLLPDFEDLPNPLLALPHYSSPNLSLAVCLDGGFEALLDRASGKRKRKKHRSQTRKFEAAGGFTRIEATSPAEVTRMLDAFFVMKEDRFRRAGIANVFGDAKVQAFFRALFTDALAASPPPFVLHGLEVDGKLRAVTGSSRSGKRLICEFGAIAEDELAHASPGDFLFFDNIREACAQGFSVYDFSVGDEPYKRLWCDIETRHMDAVVPLTLKGRAFAASMRLKAHLKAFVKTSPLIWKLTKALRKKAAGQPAASAED
ncbi:GNAT family N-acetyltransferase [Allomesorhizobium camelthorni]|uniref:GNAT family N-acetyltransferase n=1 Tax=Allomesorhizobium camelthorni TaxID=475069 RepID=A0A6G4WI36_9HYPH|nr:GNAT family N-acetyltransferase [Mesorhizobium camelthorni]NGO53757.1 GNAT family N-acetyltransferase [Mesorhizobium camelthorni]